MIEQTCGPAIAQPTTAVLEQATQMLRQGRLVAFPTETVYGLGGDAGCDRAVASIFTAKGRPSFNPLIVHVPDLDTAATLAEFNQQAELAAQHWWPGPLTLVLPRRTDARLSHLVSAGLSSVAVRVPAHPTAQALLRHAQLPLAAPSANRSGRISPTTPLHVIHEFPNGADERLAMILAGGRCSVGLESTVLDLTGPQPVILRPGAITAPMVEAALGRVGISQADAGIKAPGMLTSHYAPRLPVRLGAATADPDEAFLLFGPDLLGRGGRMRLNLSPTGDLEEAAANLFAMLRQLDQPDNWTAIAVAPIPQHGLGIAINDRLQRAAAPRGDTT